ncbi:DUF2779 domain-containing protein [Noviherbaspirillum sp.]|uniref:DUF2779 domain-containing protein n=1 Tax=Noviherbaspirillum sp. TaxID=1926288 RepID=UPI0025ECABFF|nr:DUF2779 domain-containing protein [Noviherbaspirillum sp.]
MIDAQRLGFAGALSRSAELLESGAPIFEAAFATENALCYADILLPVSGRAAWRMVEVKSSASVKDYYKDDAAIQASVALGAGVPLEQVCIAHIDTSWTYPGNGDYRGLLVEADVTGDAHALAADVEQWIAGATATVLLTSEPDRAVGPHCSDPFECPFQTHCTEGVEPATYPVSWLPNVRKKALKSLIEEGGVADLRDVPDELLNDQQLRVKTHTLAGTAYFDAAGAAADLAAHPLPAYFLDFETINLAIPIWPGTRPYQQITFQYSLHRLAENGQLDHRSFLDLSGADPSRPFAERLIIDCGRQGPIFVYNASFERTRLKELADRYGDMADALQAIVDRIVDLLPVATSRYYHPSQQGSWSIKAVLPAIAPDLRYDALDGVQNGGMAMDAFAEAIQPETTAERKREIERQLLSYCGLDTYAMVRLWHEFSGRRDIVLPDYAVGA